MNTTMPEKDEEHERILGIVFDISPAKASILSCLCRGTGATTQQLVTFAGVTSPVKPMISRMRKKLEEHGLAIESKMGVGYWMSPEDRVRVGRIVDEFVGG